MRKFFQFSGIMLICLVLHGCGIGTSYIYTLYSDSFISNKKSIKKIVLINPDFKAYKDRLDDDEQDFEKSTQMNKALIEVINKFAYKSGYKYEIVNKGGKNDNGTEFFTELLPLRKAILQAISNQDNPLNEIDNASYRQVAKSQFVVNTLIPAEMSELEKKYGTPYFSLFEVYSAHDHSYIIHIIADVSRGIVSYQEIKRLPGQIKKRELTPLIFDSFDSLRKI
jgi:hypothetical protein